MASSPALHLKAGLVALENLCCSGCLKRDGKGDRFLGGGDTAPESPNISGLKTSRYFKENEEKE